MHDFTAMSATQCVRIMRKACLIRFVMYAWLAFCSNCMQNIFKRFVFLCMQFICPFFWWVFPFISFLMPFFPISPIPLILTPVQPSSPARLPAIQLISLVTLFLIYRPPTMTFELWPSGRKITDHTFWRSHSPTSQGERPQSSLPNSKNASPYNSSNFLTVPGSSKKWKRKKKSGQLLNLDFNTVMSFIYKCKFAWQDCLTLVVIWILNNYKLWLHLAYSGHVFAALPNL